VTLAAPLSVSPPGTNQVLQTLRRRCWLRFPPLRLAILVLFMPSSCLVKAHHRCPTLVSCRRWMTKSRLASSSSHEEYHVSHVDVYEALPNVRSWAYMLYRAR
jgi:hypothetical protein